MYYGSWYEQFSRSMFSQRFILKSNLMASLWKNWLWPSQVFCAILSENQYRNKRFKWENMMKEIFARYLFSESYSVPGQFGTLKTDRVDIQQFLHPSTTRNYLNDSILFQNIQHDDIQWPIGEIGARHRFRSWDAVSYWNFANFQSQSKWEMHSEGGTLKLKIYPMPVQEEEGTCMLFSSNLQSP